jgi:hypothetical protein
MKQHNSVAAHKIVHLQLISYEISAPLEKAYLEQQRDKLNTGANVNAFLATAARCRPARGLMLHPKLVQ